MTESNHKVPKAQFEPHPPAVVFEKGSLEPDTLQELFGALALNACNVAVPREEVVTMHGGQEDENVYRFPLHPDTDQTRAHGQAMVTDFNDTVGRYHRVDPSTVTALVGTAAKRAKRGY